MSEAFALAGEETGAHGPRAHPTPVPAPAWVRQQAPAQSGSAQRCVLIADDNPDIRESLFDIIELQGYRVLEASDGIEALDVIAREHVDVVLLDLHMPGRDGVSVIRELGAPPPVVIVYSAFELFRSDEVDRLVGSKIYRTLRKPVSPVQLLSAVSDAMAELY
ncbi:MAG: response regulator [Acidimicrobiales bacterium]